MFWNLTVDYYELNQVVTLVTAAVPDGFILEQITQTLIMIWSCVLTKCFLPPTSMKMKQKQTNNNKPELQVCFHLAGETIYLYGPYSELQ